MRGSRVISSAALAHDTGYRRGAVLGLTMAEVIVLIVFSLLLAISIALGDSARSRDEAESARRAADATVAAAQSDVVQLRKLLEDLRDRLVENGYIDDIHEEWIKASAQRHAAAPQSLSDQIATVEAQVRVLEAKLRDARTSQTSSHGEQAQESEPHTPAELARENATLRGRLEYQARKLKGLGRGTEMPPCWVTRAGRIEYLYSVELTSAGLVVSATDLPHRAQERLQLPGASASLGIALSEQAFTHEHLALFEWSKAHECRFFVRVIDRTGAAEKTAYKRLLRAVEARYYKYEVHG